jgi:hypothetical protein
MFGALSVFGHGIKGMIRLQPEQVWTCNVTRNHRPLPRLLYIHDASGSRNKLGTPRCNARRILLRHEARDESSDRNSVSCQSLATLRRAVTLQARTHLQWNSIVGHEARIREWSSCHCQQQSTFHRQPSAIIAMSHTMKRNARGL